MRCDLSCAVSLGISGLGMLTTLLGFLSGTASNATAAGSIAHDPPRRLLHHEGDRGPTMKKRLLTPEEYAVEFNRPLTLVRNWMQPSRKSVSKFHPEDIDRSSPRNPRIVVVPPDARGKNERPRIIDTPRRSVHPARGAFPVKVKPSKSGAAWGVAQPMRQNVLGDSALNVVGGECMAQALQVNGRKA